MRFALLGTGRIGKLHARLLSETEGVSELLVADAQALHDRKAGAVHNRKVLVGKGFANAPRSIQVTWRDGLDRGQAAPDRGPETLRRRAPTA